MQHADDQSARERLLRAAQEILAVEGLEKLNTNRIAQRAGLTPPTFYHYFANKHAILTELAERLMLAQTAVIRVDTGASLRTRADMHAAVTRSIREGLSVTRSFRAGYQVLIAMRAIPALAHIRRDSHHAMARLVAGHFVEQGIAEHADALLARSLLAQDLKYAAIEMLFETNFAEEVEIVARTADAVTAVYALF